MPIYARTIRRGGEHLTAAIAKAFNADTERAEQAKRGDAFLVSPGRPATTPLGVKLDSVLREALAPTIRELRQTLASFRAGNRFDVDALLVVGGGGRLAGLLPFLEAELGIPARYPSIRPALEAGGEQSADVAGEEGAAPESDSYALAAAIAIGASRRLARDRLPPRAVRLPRQLLDPAPEGAGTSRRWRARCCSRAASTSAPSYSALSAERKALDKDLKTATQELFGAAARRRRGDHAADEARLPRGAGAACPRRPRSICSIRSRARCPPADKVKLDVAELDIRPKKTFIKGTVDTAAAVDEMAAKLKEIDCFDDVNKGAITEVSGGAKQFTLTIGAKCP